MPRKGQNSKIAARSGKTVEIDPKIFPRVPRAFYDATPARCEHVSMLCWLDVAHARIQCIREAVPAKFL